MLSINPFRRRRAIIPVNALVAIVLAVVRFETSDLALVP